MNVPDNKDSVPALGRLARWLRLGRNKEPLPWFELSLVLVVLIIGCAEFGLYEMRYRDRVRDRDWHDFARQAAEHQLTNFSADVEKEWKELRSQVNPDGDALKQKLDLLKQEATNSAFLHQTLTNLQQEMTALYQEARALHRQNQTMREAFGRLQSDFTNELKGVETAQIQMADTVKLVDDFKIFEEYKGMAEGLESAVKGMHAALARFLSRRTPNEVEIFKNKSQELKSWITRRKERVDVERLAPKSQDLRERIRRGDFSSSNGQPVITKDLGRLLEEIERDYEKYMVAASTLTTNYSKTYWKPPEPERVDKMVQPLLGVAREARANANALQSVLEPKARSEIQQRAIALQRAIMKAQARLDTDPAPRLPMEPPKSLVAAAQIKTNNLLDLRGDMKKLLAEAVAQSKPNKLPSLQREARGAFATALENKKSSASSWYFGLALFALVIAQVGIIIFLIAAIYRRVVVAPLRTQLLESHSIMEIQNKLIHFGELAAGLAHEIRNPLTAIQGRVYVLQKMIGEESPEYGDATVIQNEVNRLDRIVRDFLKLARPAEPRLVPMSAGPLLKTVQELLAPQYKTQAVELKLEPVADDTEFLGDEQQLKQVLINLVQNAAESMEDQSGTITLRARKESTHLKGKVAEAVILEVEDTGPGIRPEVQEHLFDPFYSTKEHGSGLGLSIVARIVDKHGGALKFDTQLGRGTTFDVVLPVHSEQQSETWFNRVKFSSAKPKEEWLTTSNLF